MPTIRLNGTITARSPIMITRPEQGDGLIDDERGPTPVPCPRSTQSLEKQSRDCCEAAPMPCASMRPNDR